MTKKKSTKRALFMSALSFLMCVTMFVGSTFAWFTDSVTSGNNVVKSGNLDLKLSYKPYGVKNTEWTEVKEDTIVFGKDALYEPGYTEAVWLKVENIGSLAFKYDLALNVENEKAGINMAGEKFNLSDYLEVKYLNTADTSMESGFYTTRESLNSFNFGGVVNSGVTSFKDDIAVIKNGTAFSKDDTTMAGYDASYVLVIISMPTTVRNEANHNGVDVPEINFTLTAVATQLVHEEDSFDNQYDVNAPEMYTVNGVKYETATAALEVAKAGDKVYFSSLSEPIVIKEAIDLTIENTNIEAAEGVNAITVNADATITAEGYNSVVGGKNADGIYVAENVALKITGKGTLIAKGNGGSETQEEYAADKGGSGIDVNGTIVVDGLASLIAEGYGKHAFGIGGATQSITIKDSTIKYAKGGMVQPEITTNWGKKEPEAGAAIGSHTDGAVIDITGSTIVKAEGGSKAAGIGAMYHTGVIVNITDSTVTAYGGNGSAGIGGSRVQKDVTSGQEIINVTIKNSTVNAVGGDFGAGIGAGYDTYCHSFDVAPVTIVTIDEASDITAQGGWLGAGIGTGHNAVNFVGNIACDTSKVKAGNSEDPTGDPVDCCGGASTSVAQNVGLGVLKISGFYTVVDDADELATAVANGASYLWLNPGEYDVKNCGGKALTISGTKDAVLKVMNEGEDGCDYGFGPGGSGVGNITFNGVTIDTTANTGNYKGYAYMGGTFNDCSFVGAYSLNNANTFVFNRCTFDFKNGYFWTWGAKEVTFNNCIFGGNSKNILAHGWESTTITINNCDFAATEKGYASGGTVWTAAVEIDPAGSNTYTINFTGENTINENYADWTRVKDDSTGHTITGLN